MSAGENARRASSRLFHQALLRELANWERNLTSEEFQQRYVQPQNTKLRFQNRDWHVSLDLIPVLLLFLGAKRVEQHKRKLLEHHDLGQEVLFETLRQQRVSQDRAVEKVKAQLLVSAAHLRVPRRRSYVFGVIWRSTSDYLC